MEGVLGEGQRARCEEYSEVNRERDPGYVFLLLLLLQCWSWVAEEENVKLSLRSLSAPRQVGAERSQLGQPLLCVPVVAQH